MNSKTIYEVVGYPVSCPEEKFSCGLYATKEQAEAEKAKAYEDYSRCEFEIELKTLYNYD